MMLIAHGYGCIYQRGPIAGGILNIVTIADLGRAERGALKQGACHRYQQRQGAKPHRQCIGNGYRRSGRFGPFHAGASVVKLFARLCAQAEVR